MSPQVLSRQVAPTEAVSQSSSLRSLLVLDMATCTVTGVALAAAAAPLAAWTGLPTGLLFWAGVALLPVALFMGLTARYLDPHSAVSRAAVRGVVFGNVAWVLASLAVLIPGVTDPRVWGVGFVLAQAAVVGVLAALEWRAARALPTYL